MPSYSKPISRFAMAGLPLGVSALTAWVTAGVGSRQGWWHFTLGLQVSEWAAYAASLPLVAMVIQWEYANRTYPAINDIRTGTRDAPIFLGHARANGLPRCNRRGTATRGLPGPGSVEANNTCQPDVLSIRWRWSRTTVGTSCPACRRKAALRPQPSACCTDLPTRWLYVRILRKVALQWTSGQGPVSGASIAE